MKPVQFDYKRPATIDEACGLLSGDDNARILAGGQSLIPMLSMRLSRPSLLIDIAHIAGLTHLVEVNQNIEFGAMVRQSAAQKNQLVKTHVPLLTKALSYVGHPPTRARGTIGGSIAHADPSAEIALVAVTLDAEITYRVDGEDELFKAAEFFIGPMLTIAPMTGCLTCLSFAKAPAICGTGFHEVAPRRSDDALASAAAQINVEPGTGIKRICLAVGSIGDFPERLDVGMLSDTALDDKSIKDAVHDAMQYIETVGDLHASAEYRKRVVTELAIRALQDARDEISMELGQ